jgi:NAD+ diphosphatase
MVTLPHLSLASNAHDRVGIRRHDQAWLDAQWTDPNSRVLLLNEGRIRPVGGRVEWLSPAALRERLPASLTGEQVHLRRILLGERDGSAWFGLIVDGLIESTGSGNQTTDSEWLALREVLLGSVADLAPEAPMIFHAVGLAQWRLMTVYCPRCGGVLEPRASGHELVCNACDRVQFPRTDPAVIMTITHGEPGTDEEAVLLGRQASWPEGRFSTLAGFVEPGESLEDAVRREVLEEVGVVVGEVAYFGNQAWPFPASLMLGMIGRAEGREIVVDKTEIAEARWFTRAELLAASQDESVLIPRGVSISSSLVQHWFGKELLSTW